MSAHDSANPSGSLALSDAAARYGISAQTLRRLCDAGQLNCERDARGWRVLPREVETYLLARRPAGRQSVSLWLQGPAPNPRLRDGVGWLFKAAGRGGVQIPIQVWFSNELVAVLQRDGYDVRDVVVRAAERLVADALLDSDDLSPYQEILFGSADRLFVLKAAGLGGESYLPSEAPAEEGVSVIYELTPRDYAQDGLWPGDSVDVGDQHYVDVVVDAPAEGSMRRVRTIRVAGESVRGTRGEVIQDALRKYEARCLRLSLPLGSWVISVATRARALTLSQQRVLEVVYEVWRSEADWPVYEYIEARMDREYDLVLREVLASFPPGLFWGLSPHMQRSDKLVLTVAGLAQCLTAAADIRLYLAIAKYLVERRRAFVPKSATASEALKVSSEDVRRDVDEAKLVPPSAVERLYDLLMQDPFLTHGGGKSVDGKWDVYVGPESRRYRGVERIDDYLARRQPDATAWDQSMASSAPRLVPAATVSYPASAGEAAQVGGLGTDESGTSSAADVFVLMPFASEFDLVWSAIQATTAELSLRCIRADTITSPGRITQQIVEAIRGATVIIADVTNNNPNVMFELGYADALAKPIVVLNQRLPEAPFDLKDWRQIEYSVEGLDRMKATLHKFLYQVLVKPGERLG